MQKKIIALALAAVAGSAAAQTNVQIYGVADLGQAFVKSSGVTDSQSTVGRLDSNSSHIGFRGTEDLGNGLKALFQYETGFDASTAGALSGGRDTYVGLTGGFGTVVAGNLTHPLRAFGAKVELAPGATGVGTTMSVTGRINGLKTGADERAANAIAYVSPAFAGFSGTVAYVNGETEANGANKAEARAYQVAAQYDNGPLFVGAGYHKAQNFATQAYGTQAAVSLGNDDASARVIRLVAVYTLPTATKLTALYDNTKATVAAGDYMKRSAWSLGVAQSFGKNTVGLEYGASGKIKDETGTAADSKSKIITALYTYELSKRTLVQARYSKLTNQAGINNNFYVNDVSNGAANGNGADYTGYMVGLRHSF